MLTAHDIENLRTLYDLVQRMRGFGGPNARSFRLDVNPAEMAALGELLRSIVEGEFDKADAPVSVSEVWAWLLAFCGRVHVPPDAQKELFKLVVDMSKGTAALPYIDQQKALAASVVDKRVHALQHAADTILQWAHQYEGQAEELSAAENEMLAKWEAHAYTIMNMKKEIG